MSGIRVLLTSADFGIGYELTPISKRVLVRYTRETGHESALIQTDWDFPSLARSLGWSMRARGERCTHRSTDGTVNCPDCGRTASYFSARAGEWLDARTDQVFQGDFEAYFGEW